MMLYHGTKASLLPRLMKEGIKPRALSKAKDNWKHTVTSNPKAVYLTTAYPGHFAAAVTKEKEPGLILEIDKADLYLPHLCPDEDFLEQVTRTQDGPNFAPTKWDMKKRTMYYRKVAKFNADKAELSLKHMGTAAYYGEIPWICVNRYVTIDWPKLDWGLRLMITDTMVSVLNYRVLANRHKAFMRWVFDDQVSAAELSGNADLEWENSSDEFKKPFVERDNHLEELMQDRSALTVVTCHA